MSVHYIGGGGSCQQKVYSRIRSIECHEIGASLAHQARQERLPDRAANRVGKGRRRDCNMLAKLFRRRKRRKYPAVFCRSSAIRPPASKVIPFTQPSFSWNLSSVVGAEERVGRRALFFRERATRLLHCILKHFPPPGRILKSNINGMLHEPRHAGCLSGFYQCANFVHLVPLESDCDLGGSHTNDHISESSDSSSALRNTAPPRFLE